jgi:hypothetical protein
MENGQLELSLHSKLLLARNNNLYLELMEEFHGGAKGQRNRD